ncbi:polyprenyl synthetase family protein [Streptomyces sp. Pv4-95]|uniref:polyprenyl synthetase family protein n=1 Tax=Streptomyces sp. Pv4-95 TaxID=3049543 RepID=UPI003891DD8E
MLCVVGHLAAAGRVSGPLLRAAASLEMFHAVALIHDDVMDDSGTRRGRPTVHRTLAARNNGRPDAERLGANAAILLGDLALVWSGELLHTAGLTPRRLTDALAVTDAMRTEVLYGQYLDVLTAGRPTTETTRALKVCRYKTAKYTVERPLHLGAVLAGAPASLLATLSDYALPVGEAFQLRDDLLGTFGDPAATGKPRLDDLRDGKNTVLLTLAMQRADPGQRHVLRTLVGVPGLDESDAARIRRILEATGARGAVERLIHTRREQAQHALDAASLPAPAEDALRRIARAATVRTA